MKIRNGFVSNSSSSSFIIQKRNLTEEQIKMIKNHVDYCYDILNKEEKNINSYKKFTEEDPYGEEIWDDNYVDINILRHILHLDGNGEYKIDKNDAWVVKDLKDMIIVDTEMNNFNMGWFLCDVVKVNQNDIEYVEY